jgi:hypothetical protein
VRGAIRFIASGGVKSDWLENRTTEGEVGDEAKPNDHRARQRDLDGRMIGGDEMGNGMKSGVCGRRRGKKEK